MLDGVLEGTSECSDDGNHGPVDIKIGGRENGTNEGWKEGTYFGFEDRF